MFCSLEVMWQMKTGLHPILVAASGVGMIPRKGLWGRWVCSMEVVGVGWEVFLSFVCLRAAVFTELMSDKIQGFCVRSCYNAFVSNKQLEETDDLLLEAL
ncbi:unnamed protein product [Trifolium pratense]|uniref:Uncharacterized protein n=1 Tax=Trifolium pratense TaxID=57577 RepID=A0ACB0KNN9_TRIPR|nr:unnamed protein product [Trifolium pratense]